VYRAPLSRLLSVCGDELTVAHYDASAFEAGSAPLGEPKRIERLSLAALRSAPVIVLDAR
jgi:hypothetical protein